MSNRAVIVPVLLLAIFVPDGYTKINCWSCASLDTEMCGSKYGFLFNEDFSKHLGWLVECQPHPNKNMKVGCLKSEHYVGDVKHVTKGCGYLPESESHTTMICPSESYKVRGYCTICTNKAGCNGAATTGTTIALLLAPLSLLLFK